VVERQQRRRYGLRDHGSRPHFLDLRHPNRSAFAPAHSTEPDIYPAIDRAKADLSAALAASAASHKRVILDFGGNWCTDCHVLDRYFHDPVNRPILDANFILVHVNVGRMDENLDIARALPDSVAQRSSGARGPR